MMPQSGQKLIYRFFQTLQVQAIGGHTLNPQLWIHQLRGARTHTDTQFHPPTSNTASFSTWGIRHTSESPFYMGEKIFKASRTEVIPSHSVALAHPAWIKGFLFLVLLRAEVAAGFGKPVVPINVGNTSTNMGNSPSPALRAAQEAGAIPALSRGWSSSATASNTTLTFVVVSKASVGQLCWFYQTPL